MDWLDLHIKIRRCLQKVVHNLKHKLLLLHFLIFTSLSPNTQKSDCELARTILLHPANYLEGSFIERVQNWFDDFFSAEYITTYESARTALYFILKGLGVKEKDEVLVQAFTCVAASNPIKWAGATPVFVDIDKKNFNVDLTDLENKITNKTKAILVQHTFGYPAPIQRILNIARDRKIFVIEDCAHTIGTEINGSKLGTIGDAAIFSLGRDKAISASFGGVAVVRQNALGKRLKAKEEFLSYPSKLWIARQLLYTIVAYRTRTLYEKFKLGKLIHLLAFKLGLVSKATSKGEKCEGSLPKHARSKLPNALARVAFHQLGKLDKLNKIRTKYKDMYFKALKDIKQVKLPNWEKLDKFYPIRIPALVERRDELLRFAEGNGVLLGNWYDTPLAPKEVDLAKSGYKSGSCPKAEEVCKRIVNLPLNVNMTNSDVDKVIDVIREFYKK
jgi:perosamine synthetase